MKKKKKSSRKKQPDRKTQVKINNKKSLNKKDNPIISEIVGVCIIVLSIFIIIGIFTDKTGLLGVVIQNTLIGLFGIGAYLLSLYGLYLGILYLKKDYRNIVRSLKFFFSLILITITFFHILYYGEQTEISLLSMSYITYAGYYNGGWLGAALSYLIIKLVGIYGSYVILIAALCIWVLLLTRFPIFSHTYAVVKDLFGCSMLKFKEKKKKDSRKIDQEEDEPSLNINSTEAEFIPDIIEYNDADNYEIVDMTPVSSSSDTICENASSENNNSFNEKQHIEKSKPANKEVIQLISINPSQVDQVDYIFPSINLLKRGENTTNKDESKKTLNNAKKLEMTLASFGVEAKVLQIQRGPSVTRYELQPRQGVKVSKIVNLADDIALNLAASGIRIEAPIPGKAAIGIEIANESSEIVYLRDVIDSDLFLAFPSKLAFALGKDITGKPVIADIGKMPHILIAGATGSGKSVCINTLITSIIYKAKPSEVKLIMIDPKVVELSVYNGIPHLLIPVVTDPKKASGALFWAVNEMTRRYNLFAENNVRDMKGYNKKVSEESDKLPNIVIIIDELADLMMTAAKEVEDAICRLAQMARAAGIHLVIATQRPSVDVITGVIKANIPSRLAFSVSSGVDSRTILDMNGAEKLLGKGDMLFYPVGESKPIRIQGAYISDKEVENIVNTIKKPDISYEQNIIDSIETTKINILQDEEDDELLENAIEFLQDKEKVSISMLQRYFRIGFNRASRLMDALEKRNIVSGDEGSKPRRVLK